MKESKSAVPPHPSPSRTEYLSWKNKALLGAVLLMALSLRIGLSNPVAIGSDMAGDYYPPALDLIEFGTGSWDQWTAWYLRLGVLIPLALAHAVSGSAEIAIPAAALPFSVAQVLIVFVIGRLLFNDSIGLLAAFFEAVYPVSVIFGSRPLPDTMMSCWVSAAFLAFIGGYKFSKNSLFCVAGVFLGLAYTAKLTGVFGGIVLLGFYFIRRRRLSPNIPWLLVAGVIVVIVFETILLSLLQGELNLRLLNVLSKSTSFYGEANAVTDWTRYFPGFVGILLWPLVGDIVYHGFFGWAAFLAGIFLVRQGRLRNEQRLVVWWSLGLLLLINFACFGFSRPIVYSVYSRYIMFITPPMVLMLAIALHAVSASVRKWVIVCIVCISLLCSYVLYSTWQPHDSGFRLLWRTVRKESTSTTTLYFQRPVIASMGKVFLGPNRKYRVAEDGEDLKSAKIGDLASVVLDNYNREARLPDGYLRWLDTGPWEKIVDWQSQPGMVANAFELLGIQTEKGFGKHIRLYRKR